MAGADPGSANLLVLSALGIEAFMVRRGVRSARVIHTGMGPEKSKRAAVRIATMPGGAVAVAGVCGALAPGLRPGDVTVATSVEGPGAETVRLDAEPLVRALAELGIEAHAGPILSIERLVKDGRRREEFRSAGIMAIDMESAWLAAGAAGRPFAVLRVVSDSSNKEFFNPFGMLVQGTRAMRMLRKSGAALEIWASRL